jgi:carboxymethylenebutenolidase
MCRKAMMRSLLISVMALLARTSGLAAQEVGGAPVRQAVEFSAGDHQLRGILFKPQGNGPFPVLIWNHGSEKSPGSGPQFESVASIFVPAGYVVFAPVRSGHGYSPGAYILDVIKQTQAGQGGEAANRVMVQLLETQQLNDQLAGLAYARRLPFVDPNRIAVAGCSYGGIETLLGAERGAGYKAATSISPGAQSWERNPLLQQRLVQAVQRIAVPVLLLQPPKDASLQPSRVLGGEAQRLRKPFTVNVYPDVGPEQEKTHCFGGAVGMHVWAKDAKAFLAANLR